MADLNQKLMRWSFRAKMATNMLAAVAIDAIYAVKWMVGDECERELTARKDRLAIAIATKPSRYVEQKNSIE